MAFDARTSAPSLELIRLDIGSALADIADLLPKEYKLTLVARHTRLPDAEIVMTDDSLPLAAEALAKRIAAGDN